MSGAQAGAVALRQESKQAGAEVDWGLGRAEAKGMIEKVVAARIADLERECMVGGEFGQATYSSDFKEG